jgi:hypothetical protein
VDVRQQPGLDLLALGADEPQAGGLGGQPGQRLGGGAQPAGAAELAAPAELTALTAAELPEAAAGRAEPAGRLRSEPAAGTTG